MDGDPAKDGAILTATSSGHLPPTGCAAALKSLAWITAGAVIAIAGAVGIVRLFGAGATFAALLFAGCCLFAGVYGATRRPASEQNASEPVREASVTLDEGGARILDAGARRYWPFESGLQAGFDAGAGVLTVFGADRSITIFGALATGREIRDRIEARRELATREIDATLAGALDRRGRPIGAWIDEIGGHASGLSKESSYRTAGAPPDEWIDAFLDVTTPLERRAALGFACLRIDPENERVLAGCSEATPPLVAALLALASPSPELVARARALSAFLDADDARALESLRAGGSRVAPVAPSDDSAAPDRMSESSSAEGGSVEQGRPATDQRPQRTS